MGNFEDLGSSLRSFPGEIARDPTRQMGWSLRRGTEPNCCGQGRCQAGVAAATRAATARVGEGGMHHRILHPVATHVRT
jgi:hypothetical protein